MNSAPRAQEPSVPIAHDVTPEELDLILEAISRHPKAAGEITPPPAEVYNITAPSGRYIYVTFVRPLDLPIGTIYRTWIAQFADGTLARLMSFRSRHGASCDDTLPDDD